MSSQSKWTKIINKMFTGRNKWITTACLIIISSVSTILIYNYLADHKMENAEDLKMLLDLMEKEISDAEQAPPGSPIYLSEVEIEKAKVLLSQARWFMERGDRTSAWMKVREFMLLFRKSILPAPPSGNESYRAEMMMRNILQGGLERARRWLNIFTNLYEKTNVEEVRKLLSNSTTELKRIIDETQGLIDKGSNVEAEEKLNEAFKLINETLRSLKMMSCFEKARQVPPHSSS